MDERNGPTISPDDDGALVARVRAGDLDAYAELVRRHAPTAVRTAALLGAGPDAEDVVQEALVKAYRSLGSFRTDQPFRPWLLRIVANEARNLHRSGVRRAAREQATTQDRAGLRLAADPADTAADHDRDSALVAALRELPEPLRRVVVCRHLLELDEKETATVLGLPRGTVKSRLHRGLARLRTALVDSGVGPEREREAGHA